MRPDEQYVLEALVEHYGGSFEPGEDPPDAYLIMGSRKIAVEVTRLIEEVVDDSGVAKSRYAEDTPGLNLVNGLDESHGKLVPDGKYVFLMVPTPINNVRALKSQLGSSIVEMLETGETERQFDVSNGTISIHIYEGNRSSGKKIIGALDNQNASPDIGYNVARILRARISDKESKRKPVQADEYWLAMVAEYWIADHDSYQRSYQEGEVSHGFDKIVLVRENKSVHELE